MLCFNFVSMFQIWGPTIVGVRASSVPNFIVFAAREDCLRTYLSSGVKKKKKKYEENPTNFTNSYLRNCCGYLLQIWYVRYGI